MTGFTNERAVPTSPEEKTVQIIAFLETEMGQIDKFQKMLKLELRELGDIKHNMKLIEEEFKKLKKAENHFDEIYKSLRKETDRDNVNVAKCNSLLNVTSQLANSIYSLMESVGREANKLIKSDMHLLYEKHAGDKAIMNSFYQNSERAKEIIADLTLMSRKITPIPQELQQISSRMQALKSEQESRKPPKRELGFK